MRQEKSLQRRILFILVIHFIALSLIAALIFVWVIVQMRLTTNNVEGEISSVVETSKVLQTIDQPRIILNTILSKGYYDPRDFAIEKNIFIDSVDTINEQITDFSALHSVAESNSHMHNHLHDHAHEIEGYHTKMEGILDSFSRNALHAIVAQEKYLRSGNAGDTGAVRAIRVHEQLAVNDHNDLRLVMIGELNAHQQKSLFSVSQRLETQNTFYLLGMSALFGSVVLLLFIFYVVMRFSVFRPLAHLTDIVDDIVQGGPSVEVPFIDRSDEIGLLARAFKLSIKQLRQNAHILEEQVEERTKRLNAKNAELKQIIEELNRTTKQLVRRDLDLTKANEQLKELDEVKTEFVSVAAHQLRTPLTAIRWTFQALKNSDHLSPDNDMLVSNATKATNNLIILVNDLLNVARIDEERFELNLKEHNITSLLSGICEEYRADAKHKGIRFVVDYDKDLLELTFDWEKIDMVVRNLLSNAIKYTESGGDVMFVVRKEKENLVIEVTDSGIGIPDHQKSRIFSKFFRADNALLHQTNGSGLGLYVTKRIIESHGGTIVLKSKEEIGTTFTVRLPLDSPGREI